MKDDMKYRQFHWDKGHDTEECYQILRYIEHLIKKGKLGQYLQMPDRENKRNLERRHEEEERARKGKGIEASTGTLNSITTVPGSNLRKRKAREIAAVSQIDPCL